MKILFISSGNVHGGISPIVLSQGKSLEPEGIKVEYFTVAGKGLRGYFKNIFRLRSHLHKNKYDIFHAHYWLSGIVAYLAGAKPLIVSLMGTESRSGKFIQTIIKYFSKKLWDHTIVKSIRTRNDLNLNEASVIPNGVNMELFRPIPRSECRKKAGLEDGKYIIFASDPARHEKNYPLAEESVSRAKIPQVQLYIVNNRPHEMMPYFMNAGDVLLLTSLWEGSPNVIKEAMACGLPIVTTDVGDVREVIDGIDGCFITSYDPDEIADKLISAIQFGHRTKGREKIRALDEKNIAKKLIRLYRDMLNE
jgi:teichuronic acid biosynthesis glycosyltransferase TuaC